MLCLSLRRDPSEIDEDENDEDEDDDDNHGEKTVMLCLSLRRSKSPWAILSNAKQTQTLKDQMNIQLEA